MLATLEILTTPTDTLIKSSESITTPASFTLLVKPSPFSKETTFAVNSVPATTKRTGSVVIAFSKKEVMEESISDIIVDTTPTVGDINSAINHQGRVLVNFAERVANIRKDIHTLRWIRAPFR